MANKSKTQTRKNRVKVPNVGPGKNAVEIESKPIASGDSKIVSKDASNTSKPTIKATSNTTKNNPPYKREMVRISITSLITFGILIALIFTM